MKRSNWIVSLVFLAVLVLVPVLTLAEYLHTPASWSVYENRALAEPPVVNLETILSGQAMERAEAFFKDHLVRRESQIKLSTRLDLLRGKRIVHDVVVTDDVLLPKPQKTQNAQENAARYAKQLRAICDAVEGYGGTFLYVQVPEQRTALEKQYPAWMQTCEPAKIGQELKKACEKEAVPMLDLSGALSDEAYYCKTDHHYNLRGAEAVYRAVCDALTDAGVNVTAEPVTFTEFDAPFLGAYGRKLYGLSPVNEALLGYEEAQSVPYVRYDDGVQTDAPVIEAEGSAVFYTAYMGGDHGQTIIKTNREELPSVLIVGDSFTNAFEALAYRSFDEMRSLDFRHYDEMTLTQYLESYQPEAVIVLRDDISAGVTTGNGDLK